MASGSAGLSALAAAAALQTDPETAVKEYFSAIERADNELYVDPLYPGVVLFRKQNHVRGYVAKRRSSKKEATREVEVLKHWADLNELTLEMPHYLPLINFGNIVLSPFVGPEIYIVEQQVSKKLEITTGKKDNVIKEDMICFRRALVLRQLDLLARAVVSPYIPTDEKGFEVISNTDVVVYYKDNMKKVLRSLEPLSVLKDENLDPIDSCLDFLTSNFLQDLPENRVRYLDTYSRNLCFRVTTGAPTELLSVTLENILRARKKTHQKYSDEDIFQRDMRFLRYRLVQVDGHRNEKIALVGEMEANIIQAPRLLDCEAAPFDREEQTNALCRFLLAKEFESARVNERSTDHLHDMLAEIRKTESGKYSIADLEKAIGIAGGCKEHYEAMSFYKALRWLGYVRDQYIPKYKAAPKTDVTDERLALYEKDKQIYKATALQALHTLMDTLYSQIEGEFSERKSITLQQGARSWTYTIEGGTDGMFTCYSGTKKGVGTPIITPHNFGYHIMGTLDPCAETTKQKIFAGLLKLAYIESIISHGN